MKRTALIIAFCLIVVNLFSQGNPSPVDLSKFGSPISGSGYINRSVVYNLIHELDKINRLSPEEMDKAFFNSIIGTPYLENEFKKGEVFTSGGNNFKDVLLRYNVYNNLIEVNLKDVRYEISNDKINSVKIDNKNFDYLSYKIGNETEKGYLELISDGEIKLYCRHSKKFKDAEPQKAMEDHPSPPEFKDLPDVYFIKNKEDKVATGFRNKKDLISTFPDYQDEIKNHIKEKNLKYNDPEDLKELLNYYNSL